ncbi:carbohydrate binding domain-containing protein [Flammeovirga kamogawensis]|uniref:PKD domain-containing protein n=1 Tax=Flammeovirga kamogawensis TaxID=373891 RepID=A0ABX8H4B3_9BACT|nr:hypothetical protein [Flammeovirga kamogawensis]MBB6460369.1 hypothetical protein [Flammeovirga kamogawensis]QWG10177.1 hypothetical protein KM029_21070 [Flammeovirga kamogawensis]TRX64629.1 hypothetical protein EO216_19000 [Flammeovirga kamogawensis]
MKRFNHILLFSLVAMLFGCQTEWEAPGAEPSHHVVYSSEGDFDNRVEIGGNISFGDVSRGVTSRTWTLPEGATIEGTENVTTSDKDVIHVVFNTVGQYDVKLSQTFSTNAFVDSTQVGTQLDTTYTVTVLDPVQLALSAKYVNTDGTLGADLDLNAENELMAGNSVRFFYTSKGEPAQLTYTFEGGTPDEIVYDQTQITDGSADETDVLYKRLGTYSVDVIADRSRPYGADTLSFTNLIKVIPSDQPVRLTDIYEKNGYIALDYSREMDPSSINAANFAVKMANNGTEWTPEIASVMIDPEEGNVVLISLENETLYNDDYIYVSYTPGSLQTTDFVKATAFIDNLLVFKPATNLLVESAFDNSFETSTAANWPYLWWGAPWDGYTLDVVDEDAKSGAKSAKISMNPGEGAILGHRDGNGENLTFTVEAGKNYEIGVWVKVISGTSTIDDAAGEVPNIIFFFEPGTDWGAGRFDFTTQTPVGEWVYARLTFQSFPDSGDYYMMFRGNNPANTSNLEFYMDDFTISEVNLRP